MLTVLGGLAERRVKLGRKPKLTEHQKREAIRRCDHDGEPVRGDCPQLQRQPQHDFPVDGMTPLPERLYKFISSAYVDEFRDRGNLLFRNLTSFKQIEDEARGDVREDDDTCCRRSNPGHRVSGC
jgi:hypothetical protein